MNVYLAVDAEITLLYQWSNFGEPIRSTKPTIRFDNKMVEYLLLYE